jgi:hypothetical protein
MYKVDENKEKELKENFLLVRKLFCSFEDIKNLTSIEREALLKIIKKEE